MGILDYTAEIMVPFDKAPAFEVKVFPEKTVVRITLQQRHIKMW